MSFCHSWVLQGERRVVNCVLFCCCWVLKGGEDEGVSLAGVATSIIYVATNILS